MPATAKETYYDLLGVSKEASQEDIRSAYLQLARKYHPDKTGGDKAAEEKLKRISEAYDTLKNPEKRAEYDASLASPFGSGGANGFDGFGDAGAHGFDFGDAGGLDDLFEGLFGRGRGARAGTAYRPAGPRKGSDIQATLTIPLEDAANGATRTIQVPHAAACSTCAGSGAAPGTQPQTCSQCQGTGQVSQGGGGFFMARPCPQCHGAGQYIAQPCPDCQGTGHIRDTHTVSVRIPAGAYTGMRLRLAGQGDAGERGAPAGDLYVQIQMAPHPRFERDGDHLKTTVDVPFTVAALGGNVRVPGINGEMNLKVPAGTQSGRTFRMRGQGMPRRRGGGKGDLLATARVTVPTHMTSEQRELLKRFTQLEKQQ